MLAVVDDTATVDGQRWIRCTQSETLCCNWLVPEEQETYQRGRCLPDSLIRREPDAADTIAREKLVPTALDSYADVPVERMLSDLRWMSMFFNRVNSYGQGPAVPFLLSEQK